MSSSRHELPPVGADTETTTGGSNSGSGSIDLSLGETETITFDFTSGGSNDSGTFSITAAPSVGMLLLNDADIGTATLTITQAQWDASGSPGSVTLAVKSSVDFSAASYTLNITCFAEGTGIDTPQGRQPIEALAPGDLVCTADGPARPVRWVGVQTVTPALSPVAERLRLVRIDAGALGRGLPHRRLCLTADHAMFLDGLLINAGAMVGRPDIAYVPKAQMPARYRIYHLELERLALILAEGAPAESFLDLLPRTCRDNHQGCEALYGRPPPMTALPYPRISAARLLPPDLLVPQKA